MPNHAPFLGVFGGFEPLNMMGRHPNPQKAHPWVTTRHLSHKWLKSVQWYTTWAELREKKYNQARTGKQNKSQKRNISHIWGQTGTQLGWLHPVMYSTCPPCCGCHGNGRCLATAHWTFCSYGRLEAERSNQFWWNLVRNSKLGPQWQSRDQILNFFTIQMADGRHVGKYSKYHNSPTNGPTMTQLGWSHPHRVFDMSAMMRLPWQRPLPSNGALYIQQLWASGGRTHKPILMKFGTQQLQLGSQWQSRDQILIFFFKFKMADGRHVGKYWKYHN